MVSKDKFMFSRAGLEGVLEPQVLLDAQAPIPTVARHLPILPFTTISLTVIVWPGHGIVEGVKNYKKGISPCPGPIIFLITISSDGRIQ
jgi:hypothetical protein